MANCHLHGFLLPFLIKIFIVPIRLTRPKHSLSWVIQGEPLQLLPGFWIRTAPGEGVSSCSLESDLDHNSDQRLEGSGFVPLKELKVLFILLKWRMLILIVQRPLSRIGIPKSSAGGSLGDGGWGLRGALWMYFPCDFCLFDLRQIN